MTRACAPLLSKSGRAAIVNVASVAGVMGAGSSIAYAASKGTMTLSLARVLGPEVRVNAVCPGLIQGTWLESGMGADAYSRLKEFAERTSPLRVTCTAGDVADAIAYFATSATVVTGETLILDGGRHLAGAPITRR